MAEILTEQELALVLAFRTAFQETCLKHPYAGIDVATRDGIKAALVEFNKGSVEVMCANCTHPRSFHWRDGGVCCQWGVKCSCMTFVDPRLPKEKL